MKIMIASFLVFTFSTLASAKSCNVSLNPVNKPEINLQLVKKLEQKGYKIVNSDQPAEYEVWADQFCGPEGYCGAKVTMTSISSGAWIEKETSSDPRNGVAFPEKATKKALNKIPSCFILDILI